MYQRILVPVDGSPCSNRGLSEAIAMAKLTDGQIRVVHVIDEPFVALGVDGVMSGGPDLFSVVREGAEHVLADAVERVRSAGVAVDHELLDSFSGRVSELIVEAAQKFSADLIVIGTHGRRGLGRMLLGSDAEQILRTAPAPVLLIRDPEVKSA